MAFVRAKCECSLFVWGRCKVCWAMSPVVSDQPEVRQVTGMWPDMSTVLAALQVCPPCSATCDTTLRLQGTAAQATSTNLGSSLASHPSFPGAISPCLSYLGDWWALPVPLPVPLRDKVLPTNSPFSPRNPSGRPGTAQVTTDYPRESLCWVCSTHLGLLIRSHHRKTLCWGGKHSGTSHLPFCFVLNHTDKELPFCFPFHFLAILSPNQSTQESPTVLS